MPEARISPDFGREGHNFAANGFLTWSHFRELLSRGYPEPFLLRLYSKKFYLRL